MEFYDESHLPASIQRLCISAKNTAVLAASTHAHRELCSRCNSSSKLELKFEATPG